MHGKHANMHGLSGGGWGLWSDWLYKTHKGGLNEALRLSEVRVTRPAVRVQSWLHRFRDSGIFIYIFLKRTHQYFNFYCALWIPPAIFLRFFSFSNQVGNPVVLLEKLQRAELSERVFESGPDSPFAAAYKASSPKLPRQLSHSTASAG